MKMPTNAHRVIRIIVYLLTVALLFSATFGGVFYLQKKVQKIKNKYENKVCLGYDPTQTD